MTYCELNQSKLADTILLTFVNNAQQDQPAEGVSPNAVENFSTTLLIKIPRAPFKLG